MNPLRIDPSRTSGIRRRAVAEMRRKLLKFRQKLREFVIKNNSFGLSVNEDLSGVSPEEQVSGFKEWLTEAMALTIFLITDGVSWIFVYLKEAHDQGVNRTYEDLGLTPLDVTKWDFTSEIEALNDFSKSRLSRETMEELKLHLNTAIAAVIASLIANLTLKFVENRVRTPTELYSELLQAISTAENRLISLLRTEIVRAQAEGQLDIFQQTNTKNLILMVEWRTSGDKNVCPKCQANAGHTYTLEEARGLIPLHFNCNCSWGFVRP